MGSDTWHAWRMRGDEQGSVTLCARSDHFKIVLLGQYLSQRTLKPSRLGLELRLASAAFMELSMVLKASRGHNNTNVCLLHFPSSKLGEKL